MTSSTVDVILQTEPSIIEADDKLDCNDDDVVDGFDHRRCSLQLIDWKTENIVTTDGDCPTGKELDDRDVHLTWKTIDPAPSVVIGQYIMSYICVCIYIIV